MKAKLIEYGVNHGGSFGIDFEAENLEDAALLVRFGINFTKEVIYASTDASSDGRITSCVVIGKKKKSEGQITH